MAVVLQHQLVIRPRRALLERVGDLPEPLPWFLRTHVWTAPSAGDHDYEGQHANALTTAKLVFLAAVHRLSRGAGGEVEADVQQAALAVVAGQSLDEQFFDAHWDLEDVSFGPSLSVEWMWSVLAQQDLSAVTAPDRAGLVGSFRESWERSAHGREGVIIRRVELWVRAVARLAHHFGVCEVSIHDPDDLVPVGVIKPRLEAVGVALVERAELEVQPSSRLAHGSERVFGYRWYGGRRTRSGNRLLVEEGELLGRRNETGDDWEMWIETVVKRELSREGDPPEEGSD